MARARSGPPKRKRITEKLAGEIERAYLAGESQRKISARIGFSQQAVSQVLRERGVARPRRERKPEEPLRDAKLIPISERVKISMDIAVRLADKKPPSWSEMEREFGINRQSLQRFYENHMEMSRGYSDPVGRRTVEEVYMRWTLMSEAHYQEAATAPKPSERTAALRAALDCDVKRLELLAVQGRLGTEIDELRVLQVAVKRLKAIFTEEQWEELEKVVQTITPIVDGIPQTIDGIYQRAIPEAAA